MVLICDRAVLPLRLGTCLEAYPVLMIVLYPLIAISLRNNLQGQDTCVGVM